MGEYKVIKIGKFDELKIDNELKLAAYKNDKDTKYFDLKTGKFRDISAVELMFSDFKTTEKKNIHAFDVDNNTEVSVLIGKTITEIKNNYNSELIFSLSSGEQYMMHHEPDCCEYVEIEDINGNLDDLIGTPIIMAEEVTHEGDNGDDSFTWTFYKFATIKGYVTIRWYGESNGYYSERVDFVKIK